MSYRRTKHLVREHTRTLPSGRKIPVRTHYRGSGKRIKRVDIRDIKDPGDIYDYIDTVQMMDDIEMGIAEGNLDIVAVEDWLDEGFYMILSGEGVGVRFKFWHDDYVIYDVFGEKYGDDVPREVTDKWLDLERDVREEQALESYLTVMGDYGGNKYIESDIVDGIFKLIQDGHTKSFNKLMELYPGENLEIRGN